MACYHAAPSAAQSFAPAARGGAGRALGGITAWCVLLAVFGHSAELGILLVGAGLWFFVTSVLHLSASPNEGPPARPRLWVMMLSTVAAYYAPWAAWLVSEGGLAHPSALLFVPLVGPPLAIWYFADLHATLWSEYELLLAGLEGGVLLWAMSCATGWMGLRYGHDGWALALVGVIAVSLALAFLSYLFGESIASC